MGISLDLIRQAADMGENLLHRYEDKNGNECFNDYIVEFNSKLETITIIETADDTVVAQTPYK